MESPQINPGNSLAVKIAEIGERDRVDIILTNPPSGVEEERGIPGEFPERQADGGNCAALSSAHHAQDWARA